MAVSVEPVAERLPIPFGWFRVAYPDELPPGAVRAVRAAGRELVVWRGLDGALHCQDAFCPHLGAHLAVGGTVDARGLRCPFHGWAFDGDGANCDIPYSERTNGRARLVTHPVVERNGLVMAWLHPEGAPPAWEVPDFPETRDPDFTPYLTSRYEIRTSVQEMGENAVDRMHFPRVHGNPAPTDILSYELAGPVAHVHASVTFVTPWGDMPGELEIAQHGPGLSATWLRGFVDTLLVATQTPIDDERSELCFHFTLRRQASDAETDEIARLYTDDINRQVQQDIPIWEHKAYVPRPALGDNDGPILEFRRWHEQFYAVGA